jgi:hypothetical protein
MYKRGTFEPLALHSGVVSGQCDSIGKRCLFRCENEIVMKETKTIRNKWLTIRLSEEEEKRLHRLQEKTTSNSLSEYARKILLREPVTVKFRNQVADDFLSEMILLKFELNAIGKNFNQVVHKLHTLDTVAEIKAWIILNENSKKSFTRKIEEISDKINKVYMLWLQK